MVPKLVIIDSRASALTEEDYVSIKEGKKERQRGYKKSC